MTTQEAIETLGRLKHYIQTDVNRYGGGWDSIVEAIDTVVEHCEQKTYTPAEMESFYTWTNDNGWYYGELTELWHNDEEDLEGLIIDDVLKLWKEETR